MVASNSGGTSVGGDQTFTTPPAAPLIAEEAVSGIHSESALIHAKINPGGGATTYHFEYGTDASYGTSVPVTDESVGSGRSLKAVQRELSGLSPDTTYHWRLTATNARGTTLGADRTFTTFPFLTALTEECPNALSRQQTGAALLLDCRAYELVSAPNTGGYNVESDLSSGQTPFGDYPEVDGRVLYGVDDGGIPGTNHPTNKGVDPYVATRVPMAGRPNMSVYPPMTPSRKALSPRFPQARTRASKPSRSAVPAAVRRALLAATPVRRFIGRMANSSKAWSVRRSRSVGQVRRLHRHAALFRRRPLHLRHDLSLRPGRERRNRRHLDL